MLTFRRALRTGKLSFHGMVPSFLFCFTLDETRISSRRSLFLARVSSTRHRHTLPHVLALAPVSFISFCVLIFTRKIPSPFRFGIRFAFRTPRLRTPTLAQCLRLPIKALHCLCNVRTVDSSVWCSLYACFLCCFSFPGLCLCVCFFPFFVPDWFCFANFPLFPSVTQAQRWRFSGW